jgi:hypothetical protein
MAQVETSSDDQDAEIRSLFSFQPVSAETPGFGRKGITIT